LYQNESCPPHKWTYKAKDEGNEYMLCEKCKKLPGSLNREENL